jgi:dienelactone hydrolase
MPDIFDNDPVPVPTLTNPTPPINRDWATKHNTSRVDDIVGKTISGMKQELGAKKIGSVGFCFGAKYTIRFLAEGKGIDVAFVAHPTALEDSETNSIGGPISIASAGEYLILSRFRILYHPGFQRTDNFSFATRK